MYEITCLDSNGNSINYFTQWDVNQKIRIIARDCDSDYFGTNPQVHFANNKSDVAEKVAGANVEVTTTYVENDTVVAVVPNNLLQHPYPLLVYVYAEYVDDGYYEEFPGGNTRYYSPQKTVLTTEIPIRKRAKPSDKNYVENIERITAQSIKQEVERETEYTRDQAILTINREKSDAIEFFNTQKSIVEGLKNDTNTIYQNTVAVANTTKSEIETDIRTMMLENGMEIKTTDDGNGNVTMAIVIS